MNTLLIAIVVTFVLIWVAGFNAAILLKNHLDGIKPAAYGHAAFTLICTAGGVYYLISLVGMASRLG